MQSFPFFIKIGFEHISDLAGIDHILFLIALCAVYRLQQWKHVLILVTAFTIGHSITLALVSLGSLSIPSSLIEFLIPVTIVVVALNNVITQPTTTGKMTRNYAMALFFGLIHGMGFSNYFRALLMDSGSVVMPLLGFNLGIELGQLLVVALIVGASYLCLNVVGVKQRDWTVFVSGGAFGLGLKMMADTWPW
ncbi:MAG: HupE/UreJ family protein [Pseudomonadota bacterium]